VVGQKIAEKPGVVKKAKVWTALEISNHPKTVID